jgi:hypothetical protein
MPEVVRVELPELPKGLAFEDFIAAYFQSVGFFVEKNISVENILQLDLSLTDYENLPHTKLVEIKSGEWEFKEVFKVKGWMFYSNVSKGLFIVQKGREKFDYYRNIAHELGIQLLVVPQLDKTNEYLEKPLKSRQAETKDVETFRYTYWIEREYLRLLNAWKKTNKSVKRYKALEDYYFEINCKSYFSTNLLDKTKLIYDTHNRYFHISAKCACEMTGADFNIDNAEIPYEIFKPTFYLCEFNVIQVSTYLEHQSRLHLLKCSVDYLLFKAVKDSRAEDRDEFLGIVFSKFSFLPNSFIRAIDLLKTHSHYKLYPVFWQWFTLAMGGFILLDIKVREYELLSLKTGVPIEEIDNALSAFDILFPNPGGWFQTNRRSNIRELKVFSMPLRGVGANYRRLVYCEQADGSDGEYDDLPISNLYALKDLKRWNNLSVEVLSKAKSINE